ncbi:MAG: hypothetical protein ING71_02715 [Rhodocyclaceae bacterium]|nr:hypothetical protein [Rhodocyclaceae bacterium]
MSRAFLGDARRHRLELLALAKSSSDLVPELVFSITTVLYGSFVRDKELPRDIDILIFAHAKVDIAKSEFAGWRSKFDRIRDTAARANPKADIQIFVARNGQLLTGGDHATLSAAKFSDRTFRKLREGNEVYPGTGGFVIKS